MGVLNLTPDSFHAGSRATTVDQAIARALQLQTDGADILDIGGESSRPGSAPVDTAEEMRRVIPVLEALKGKLTIPISIDTRKPAVARAAINAGAFLLNDITGFDNPEMVAIARDHDIDICVMHMQKSPETMQDNPDYPLGVESFLNYWFNEKIKSLTEAGIRPEKIILDPGIGFGKTVADNLEIIHNLPKFKRLGYRMLFGCSRKSFMAKILGLTTENLLPSTIAVNTLAIAAGIDIIRVHDVKEHRAVIDFMTTYTKHIDEHIIELPW